MARVSGAKVHRITIDILLANAVRTLSPYCDGWLRHMQSAGRRFALGVARMKKILIVTLVFAGLANPFSPADDRPPVTQPRATSGDSAVEPDWTEKLTITVGPKDADIVGATDKGIQAGVDYVARLGGGTVKI